MYIQSVLYFFEEPFIVRTFIKLFHKFIYISYIYIYILIIIIFNIFITSEFWIFPFFFFYYHKILVIDKIILLK